MADLAVTNDVSTVVDQAFGTLNGWMKTVIFAPVPLGAQTTIPLAIVFLLGAAIYLTLALGLPQFRAFTHAIAVVRGRYDHPSDRGEVSSWQALNSALSATVGLGNIGGVAVAIILGGPGAAFWLVVAGFLGMAAKCTEVTLALAYRETRADGRIMGGAMYYLTKGLAERGYPGVGRVLGCIFAWCCMGASFGGGNAVQISQSLGALSATFPWLNEYRGLYGLIMAGAVGVVIIGGIKRIAKIADRVVPLMCGIYLLATSAILILRYDALPGALVEIVTQAWSPDAIYGGFLGVLVVGFQRAAFSNEAGTGSSAIAHCAAKTPHAVREGIVALLEPFIDTVVVCLMSALVIVVTGAYANPAYSAARETTQGAALTSAAMGEVLPFFPYVLAVTVVLFAYSTMISWSYYGERCCAYIFGDRSSTIYQLVFCGFIWLGSLASARNILEFGDLLLFAMALPNLIGVLWLAPKVRRMFNDYLVRLKRGEFPRYK